MRARALESLIHGLWDIAGRFIPEGEEYEPMRELLFYEARRRVELLYRHGGPPFGERLIKGESMIDDIRCRNLESDIRLLGYIASYFIPEGEEYAEFREILRFEVYRRMEMLKDGGHTPWNCAVIPFPKRSDKG